MKKQLSIAVASAASIIMIGATAASAAVDVDPATGTGFIGKGDVQYTLGLNNNQIQKMNFDSAFSIVSLSSVDSEWICSRTNSQGFEQTQERARTTTTTTSGLLASTARVKNQITGYHVTGYSGGSTTSSSTEGQALGSCATGWTAGAVTSGEPVDLGTVVKVNDEELISPSA